MLRALKIVVGLTYLFERKDPVDDRMDLLVSQKRIHFPKVVTRAHSNSVNAGIGAADAIDIRARPEAGQHAYLGNVATGPDRFDGSGVGLRSAQFQDMADTVSMGI